MWTSRTGTSNGEASSPSTSSAPTVTVLPPEPQQAEHHSSSSSGPSSRPSSGRSRHRRHHQQHHARQHQHQGQHRYHFNHLEAGMPLNFWGIDRRDVWRTCFCFHVRTVTIFIGVCHLVSKDKKGVLEVGIYC